MNKKELWLKLKAYHFDHLVPAHLWDYIAKNLGGADASSQAFAGKIARKLGWSKKFALKAITEYKKFVFLGIISDFNVTPSKIIDQVWHEHLLFTKAYREFCSDVIHYEFDHNPELVPMIDQTGTFNAQYLDTIALYKTEFGINPPYNIWALPKFDKQAVISDGYESKKKKKNFDTGDNVVYYDPLYNYFASEQTESYPEFSGFSGGEGGGGGADGNWDSSEVSNSHGSSDSSDSNSDSGSSSCSSSGCSSGCGGGGD